MRVQQSVIPLVWNCFRLNCWPKNNQPANGVHEEEQMTWVMTEAPLKAWEKLRLIWM